MEEHLTLLMDSIKESDCITGVEIEGAESLGRFDNFKLDPSHGGRSNFAKLARHCTEFILGTFGRRPDFAKASALLGLGNCCDRHVMVPCSRPVKVDQNRSELVSGKRLKNQVT